MSSTYDPLRLARFVKASYAITGDATKTHERAYERFGRYSSRAIGNVLSHLQTVKTYARGLSTRADTAKISQLRPPSITGGTEKLRVSFTANFDFPGGKSTKGRRQVGFTRDIDRPTTLGDLRESVRQMIIGEMQQFYDQSVGQIGRRIRGVNITGLESF